MPDMASDNADDIYFIRDAGDEWVSPTPADEVVVDAVTAATDLTRSDIDDIGAYVDLTEFRRLLNEDAATLTFTVEGYEVVVDSTGDIEVET